MDSVSAATAWLEPSSAERIALHGNCSFGRLSENTVHIASPKASRRHATIHVQDGEFWLVDLGSSNGTFHNGRRIIRPAPLKDGDSITIADSSYVFRRPGNAGSGGTDETQIEATRVEIRKADCWLLITDIEDFTLLSQRLSPNALAEAMGAWVARCKEQVERNGGSINKYLGDGFLAYWRAEDDSARKVAATLKALSGFAGKELIGFRAIVHHGTVAFGGAATVGEESLMGPDVNFAFRMEKLAGVLRVPFFFSEAANALLSPHLPTLRVADEHELKGFPGTYRFFRLG